MLGPEEAEVGMRQLQAGELDKNGSKHNNSNEQSRPSFGRGGAGPAAGEQSDSSLALVKLKVNLRMSLQNTASLQTVAAVALRSA